MSARLELTSMLIHSLILFLSAEDLLVERISVHKSNKTSNASFNEILHYKNMQNTSVIMDNSLDKEPESKHSTHLYTPTAIAESPTTIAKKAIHRQDTNNSQGALLARTFVKTRRPTHIHNCTTSSPYSKSNDSHVYKILQYILIPVGCVLFFIALMVMVRHIQRVKKKRRLERELLHQYSYPNSEAGDLDEEERFLEVESVINTQFNISSDQEEKSTVDEIPQVTVTIGEGSKLVMQDSLSLLDDTDASTSFNC